MRNAAATLEVGGQRPPQQAAGNPVSKPGGGVMRFAYLSGSRPLDGYTIKRGIGAGGFGEVYFAVSDAGKEVALKRIQRNLDVEIRGVTQCLNLKHPHLISLYDIKYDDEGQAWVVMEYVSGESLKEVIERNPHGLPADAVRRWFRGICAGVACLHEHGIVHRDLKPGNIFMDQGTVKIGDYGLSKYISCSRRSGQTESVGTFHYMAPEIGRGVYGKEIDVYALGIILFEMLTGRVPFDGESSQEIIMKHLTAEPDLAGVPAPFHAVIRKALAKDPRHRYDNVEEMLAACESPGAFEMEFGPLREIVRAEVVSPPTGGAACSRSTPPEPIAQALRGAWAKSLHWWSHAHLSTFVKVLLLLLGVFLLMLNSHWLLPLLMALGATYLIYFGIRALVLASHRPAALPPPSTPPLAAVPMTRHQERLAAHTRRKRWREEAQQALRKKTLLEAVGELSGSLLMSAAAAAVLCLVMMIVGNKPLDDSLYTWTFYAWLTLTCVAGAWVVLTISKFWEGHEGEHFRRRFVMLIAGLLVGLVAFALGDFLNVRLTDELIVRALPGRSIPHHMYEASGSLKLPAFLVYFALLFAVVRWWAQADPLRATRLSLWATGVCVFWAWIWHMLWPFPQPWGFILAASISLSVQLSAPWLNLKERARIREHLHEA